MTEELDKMLTDIVNMDDFEKVEIGRKGLRAIYIQLHEEEDYSRQEAAEFVIDLTKLFVSADKKTANKEYEFFTKVTNADITNDEFFAATNYGSNTKFVDAMMARIFNFEEKTRKAITLYAIALCASDDCISEEEVDLIEQIMEYKGEDDE